MRKASANEKMIAVYEQYGSYVCLVIHWEVLLFRNPSTVMHVSLAYDVSGTLYFGSI